MTMINVVLCLYKYTNCNYVIIKFKSYVKINDKLKNLSFKIEENKIIK